MVSDEPLLWVDISLLWYWQLLWFMSLPASWNMFSIGMLSICKTSCSLRYREFNGVNDYGRLSILRMYVKTRLKFTHLFCSWVKHYTFLDSSILESTHSDTKRQWSSCSEDWTCACSLDYLDGFWLGFQRARYSDHPVKNSICLCDVIIPSHKYTDGQRDLRVDSYNLENRLECMAAWINCEYWLAILVQGVTLNTTHL